MQDFIRDLEPQVIGPMTFRSRALTFLFLALTAAALAGLCGCGGSRDLAVAPPPPTPRRIDSNPTPAASVEVPYKVSPQGGLPATGPGARYNHCERIWCTVHRENFFIDHFLRGHVGWILHDEASGDVFVLRGRKGGPSFPKAFREVLLLCGEHVHPFLLAGYGGGGRVGGTYSPSLGYSRAHYRQYGTQLESCCINGLGWDYIHSRGGRFFKFHDLEEYRGHPERGWQKPFTGSALANGAPSGGSSSGG